MNEDEHYRNKWLVLLSIGMGVFLATIDGSIVNIALPTLVKSFNTKFSVVQWVPLAYMLTMATLILTVGRLGDMRGKKRIYLAGMIIFSIGSVLCGLSQTVYWLIFFRVMQGIGASMMAALGAALVTEAFPDHERGKALGSVGGIVSIGIITGPVLGGILIDALSWHWIFFVNIPVGIAGSLMVLKFVPGHRNPGEQKFDFTGAVTMFVSILAFLLALTLGQNYGFTNPWIIILFSLWLITSVMFFYFELHIKQPMLDLHIFRIRLFSLNLFSGFSIFVALAGVVILMPFYLENILGYSPHQVGLLLATVPLSAGFSSPLAGILSDKYGTGAISVTGLTLLVAGFYSLTMLNEDTTALVYILCFLPVGFGIGIFQSPNNSSIMGAAPKKYLGVVSGLLSISRTLGQTTGIALIGAFWAWRVSLYAGKEIAAEPTRTDKIAQVHGLHDAFTAIVILIAAVLIFNIFSLLGRRKVKES